MASIRAYRTENAAHEKAFGLGWSEAFLLKNTLPRPALGGLGLFFRSPATKIDKGD